jgi:hypothetical protein
MKWTIFVTIAISFALSQDAASEEGLTFYPVKQCRVLDTRFNTEAWCGDFDYDGELEDWECLGGIPKGGMLGLVLAGDSSRIVLKNRGYSEEKKTTIGDQGGAPDGCGVPRDAKVVSMIIAVVPIWKDKPGHLKIWPFEITGYHPFWPIPIPAKAPNTSSINFSAGETAESTFLLQQICDPAIANFGDCNEDILVSAYGSPVHLIIDVNGYFK